MPDVHPPPQITLYATVATGPCAETCMDPGRALCFVLANPPSPPLAQLPPMPPPGAPLLYSGYAGGTL